MTGGATVFQWVCSMFGACRECCRSSEPNSADRRLRGKRTGGYDNSWREFALAWTIMFVLLLGNYALNAKPVLPLEEPDRAEFAEAHAACSDARSGMDAWEDELAVFGPRPLKSMGAIRACTAAAGRDRGSATTLFLLVVQSSKGFCANGITDRQPRGPRDCSLEPSLPSVFNLLRKPHARPAFEDANAELRRLYRNGRWRESGTSGYRGTTRFVRTRVLARMEDGFRTAEAEGVMAWVLRIPRDGMSLLLLGMFLFVFVVDLSVRLRVAREAE